MRTSRALLVCMLLVSTSCLSETVALHYRYPEGSETTYLLRARARADWDIGGRGSGSYDVVFEVTETVESTDSGSTVLTVEMLPIEVEEAGLPSPGSAKRTFRLALDENGRVLEVLDVDGIAATSLEPDQLLFIGTYRPALPLEGVRLDQRWGAEQHLQLPAAFQQIESTGRLESFALANDTDVAIISYEGGGPLATGTKLPQGEAELSGTVASNTQAFFEIDAGRLRSAVSHTTGSFEVRVVTSGTKLPITGSMDLQLDLSVERTAGG